MTVAQTTARGHILHLGNVRGVSSLIEKECTRALLCDLASDYLRLGLFNELVRAGPVAQVVVLQGLNDPGAIEL